MTDRPVLIERLRAVEAERVEEVEALTASLIEVNRQHAEDTIERDRWREDAERLAKALVICVSPFAPDYPPNISDALAAHDAMTKEQG